MSDGWLTLGGRPLFFVILFACLFAAVPVQAALTQYTFENMSRGEEGEFYNYSTTPGGNTTTDWLITRNADVYSNIDQAGSYAGIGAYYYSYPGYYDYQVHRVFMYFDTSSLPSTANLTNGYLSLSISSGYSSSTASAINITCDQPNYPGLTTPAPTNFNQNKYPHIDLGTLPLSDITFPRNNVTLSNRGLAEINKTGANAITKFILRDSYYDIGNVAPGNTTPSGYINGTLQYINTQRGGSIYRNFLHLTYDFPMNPTASCTPDLQEGNTGALTCTGSYSGYIPDSWYWSIEKAGAAPITSTSQSPVFQLPSPGTYNVNLRVTNATSGTQWTNETTTQTATLVSSDIPEGDTHHSPGTQWVTPGSGSSPTAAVYGIYWTEPVSTQYYIWLLGGYQSNSAAPLSSIWYTTDGVTLTQMNASAAFTARYNTAGAWFNNYLILTGGTGGAGTTNYNDTWYSTDGNIWRQAGSGNSAWQPRTYHDLAVHSDGKLYLVGGTNSTTGTEQTDVWALTAANITSGTWSLVCSSCAPSGGRGLFSFAGRLWDVTSSSVYSSVNGTTWTYRAANPVGGITSVTGLKDGALLHYSTYAVATKNGTIWTVQNLSTPVTWLGRAVNFTSANVSQVWNGYEGVWWLQPSFTTTPFFPNAKVSLPPPDASAIPLSSTGTAPLSVAWTDTSYGLVTQWTWDFKDGYMSYIADASHVFTAAGSYNVTFTPLSMFGDDVLNLSVTVATGQQQVNYYTQRTTKLRVVDAYGDPIVGANVTLTYIASQLPSTDISWLVSAFGISTSVAEEMVNSGLAMQGWTGDDGATSFVLFPALTYGITIQNATLGLNNYRTLTPADGEYNIYCPISGQRVERSMTEQLGNTTFWYTLPDPYHMTICAGYMDDTGYTTDLRFNIYKWSNMTSNAGLPAQVYTYDFGPVSSTTYVQDCNTTVPVIAGDEYRWQWNISRSQYV